MTVFIVVSIIVVVGLAVAATLGRLGHSDLQMHPPVSSVGGWGPAGAGDEPLRADDIEDVRFDTAVRGYRMDQVDALLERVRATLAAAEAAAGQAETNERSSEFSDYPEAPTWPHEPGTVASVRQFPTGGIRNSRTTAPRHLHEEPRRDGPHPREKE